MINRDGSFADRNGMNRGRNMKTLQELYEDILEQKVKAAEPLPAQYDPRYLDCLLNPRQYAPVVPSAECEQCSYDRACRRSCLFDAIEEQKDGRLWINPERCVGCGDCIEACKEGHLVMSKDGLAAMRAVRRSPGKAYLMVAPAFVGQFGEGVTPGKLRSACKALGFAGMVEVALFADILTLKEALEFQKHVRETGDYQLTSCCCPVWIRMIRGKYHELLPHVPGAVSPMVACGRMLKKMKKEAVTVFVGPCLAKKAEAREADIADAVDYVLTFEEWKELLDAAGIRPEDLPEDERNHASSAGRLYARAGGVSKAVSEMVMQLGDSAKEEALNIKSEKASGTKACMELIRRIQAGETDANFFEGMGCEGGCVGGPKRLAPVDDGKKWVDQYAADAKFHTPLENPYVLRMLQDLGFDTVEQLLEDESLFTRVF